MNTPFAPVTAPSQSFPKHYLFMLPDTVSLEEQEEVAMTAKALLDDCYVYIVTSHAKSTEDRDQIRYMPLHPESLPCFGEVAGVMVARDAELAQRAKEQYAGAPVMVFDPGVELPMRYAGRAPQATTRPFPAATRPALPLVTSLVEEGMVQPMREAA